MCLSLSICRNSSRLKLPIISQSGGIGIVWVWVVGVNGRSCWGGSGRGIGLGSWLFLSTTDWETSFSEAGGVEVDCVDGASSVLKGRLKVEMVASNESID